MSDSIQIHAFGSETRLSIGYLPGDHWSRYLLVDEQPAFFVGGSCNTCEFLFEKKRGTIHPSLAPKDVARRLAQGDNLLSPELLETVGQALPQGSYSVSVSEARPKLTLPCDPHDYFANEALTVWPIDPDAGVANTPRTPYYRDATLELPDRIRS